MVTDDSAASGNASSSAAIINTGGTASGRLGQISTSGGGSSYAYPAGHLTTAMPADTGTITGVSSSNVDSSSMPSDLEFVARATTVLSNAKSNGWNVFTFHNTLTDALMNGSLQNGNLQNPSSILRTLPTDWQTKYAQNPDALEHLFANIQNLVGVAKSIWGNTSGPGGAQSGWQTYDSAMPQVADWNQQGVQSPYQQHQSASLQSNQGTEKDGYADHPDYVGRLGTDVTEAYSLYKTGQAAVSVGSSGLEALSSAEGVSSLGEAVLGSVPGVIGEGGVLSAMGAGEATIAAVGAATGVAEVAAAATGLAVVAYGVYKLAGGSGNVPFLDNVASKIQSTFDVFSSFIP